MMHLAIRPDTPCDLNQAIHRHMEVHCIDRMDPYGGIDRRDQVPFQERTLTVSYLHRGMDTNSASSRIHSGRARR